MKKPITIVAGGTLLLCLIAVVYFGNRAWRCQDLEIAYLNGLASMKTNAQVPAIVSNAEIEKNIRYLQDLETMRAKFLLKTIAEECGPAAVKEASEKGSHLILE